MKNGIRKLMNILGIKKMEFNGNTVKNIVIVLLSLGLIAFYIFTPTNVDKNMYDKEIKKLEAENESLLSANDSILDINEKIDSEIKEIKYSIYLTTNKLSTANTKIKTLQNEKDKIVPYVSNMDSDAVAREFTEYLNRREGKNKKGN